MTPTKDKQGRPGFQIPDDFLVLTGECMNNDVRENHARALVMALSMGRHTATMLEGLEDAMCRKLEEIRVLLETLTTNGSQDHEAAVLDRERLTRLKGDVDALGEKMRDHVKEHRVDEKGWKAAALRWAVPAVSALVGAAASAALLINYILGKTS